MRRLLYPLLLLALALPLALSGCARSSTTMTDTGMAGGGVEDVVSVPVEAGSSDAMNLLGATTSASNTIMENARAIPNLSNFVEAVEAAGLAETLDGSAEAYTVFAPTNEAFDLADLAEFDMMSENDAENLEQLLRSHVADDEMAYDELSEGTVVVTLSGEEFAIGRDENDQLSKRIGDADFIVYDIESSNGVIHLINLVLNPQNE